MNRPSIRLLADKHIYKLSAFLSPLIDVHYFDPEIGLPKAQEFDALAIRTVSVLDEQWIHQNCDSLKFIGTASAGFDHVPVSILQQKGIQFSSSIGCNALAVAEYIISSLLLWAEKHSTSLVGKKIGIIGVGHVGTQVLHLVSRFGMIPVLYDPPKANRESDFESADFSELLRCDILTFHTPLDSSTRHYFSEKWFGNSRFQLLINAARGGILDENHVLNQLKLGFLGDVIIDCWESEPLFNSELRDRAFIATPHIAGYSEQAKINATSIMMAALHSYFGLPFVEKTLENLAPIFIQSEAKTLSELISQTHSLTNYHHELSLVQTENSTEKRKAFSTLRLKTPYRQEFGQLALSKKQHFILPEASKLGFTTF